jgi:hypothetical protein
MHATRFDRFATAIAARTPRRTTLGWLAGSTLGVALGMVPRPPVRLLSGTERAVAKGRRQKKQKRKKRPCAAGLTASGGGTCGCPAGSVPYAGGCCVPFAGGCCPVGGEISGGQCCPPGYVGVSDGCCPRGRTVRCGATRCCPDGSGCCGDSCCTAGVGCCGGALCQPPGFQCCTKDCGGPGNPCPLNRAALCPPLETCCFVNNAVGFICCPVGFTCDINGVSGFGSCVQ